MVGKSMSSNSPRKRSVRALEGEVVIGKDILELLTSAMYTDPLSLYREYVQNACDSIDEAEEIGLLASHSEGAIQITVDSQLRSIRIRDNGTGIGADKVQDILVAIGASQKRGTNKRGFRGVGRLCGLGYAQTLIFRTRTRKISL